ncbi:MAG: hypothetical protein HC852_11605 [Acaryochloridaceae cyanobacterium RU_4_10]|nr:hypothetical protein [Acaryochloridaceae cyanobacterium RU_4_10]
MTSVRHSAVSSSALVEDHASQLIDELFQGLEDELDGLGKQPSTSTDRHGSLASNSLLLRLQPSDPEIEETGLLVPYIKMEDATLESFYNTDLTSPPPSTSDPSNDGFGQGILLGMACFSLIGSIGLWLFTQVKQPVAPSVAAQPIPQVSTPANPADVAFATESEQTLQALENSPPPLAVTSVATAATAALPSITANPAPAAAIAPSVALPAKKTVSVAVKNPPSAPPSAYVRKIESAPLPSLQPLALSTVPDPKSPASKVIQAPVAAIPTTVPNLAPQALPMGRQAKAGKAAKAGVTVQGILDLGDKSAILIARNGSTQNIHPGETLDSTGWVFVRVENGQAIVQRGNEVRAVSGGEEF